LRNSNTFTGREWDKETGLYYYRGRYGDPMDGRFISKDPIGMAGGINLYSYVKSNSLNRKDPSGLIDPIDPAYNYETDPTITTTVPIAVPANMGSPYEELSTIAREDFDRNQLWDFAKDKAEGKVKGYLEDLIKKGFKKVPTGIRWCGKGASTALDYLLSPNSAY